MSPSLALRPRVLIAAAASLLVAATLGVVGAPPAAADNTTANHDALRTGWDPDEAALAPSSVSDPSFGQLFSTQLDGQIYAQPVIGDGTVLVTTERDKVYGLDPVTGTIKWSRDVGPSWPASAIGCGDLQPDIGSTATPVYDAATHTAYFTAKVADGPDLAHPHWYVHAVDMATGAERAGFPTVVAGAPTNDPTHPFDARTAMQRPGLLELDGRIWLGFASHCDYGPYVGYVVGVDAVRGGVSTIWATQQVAVASGSGIWQGGGGLVSDGDGQIIFTTGNGVSPKAGPGTSPPSALGESVVRVAIGADGRLSAKDFFSPVNNSLLDRDDADLGSGGPMALPDGYGTAAHPHLLVQVGKDGRVLLLDRDHLGGQGQGPGGGDAVLQTAGPYNGVWGSPAFYGGEGGYVYTVESEGYLRAYRVGVSGSGLPSLTSVGTTTSTWGYTSGSPLVTSSGTTPGSALVWAVYASGSSGSGGQLRAYDAVPSGGVLKLRYSAPIGTATKFAPPAASAGRTYVGTRDGRLYGFGRPAASALTGTPTDFGSVPVGSQVTKSVTVRATTTTTVTGISAPAPFSVGATTLPTTLAAGASLTVPVTYRAATVGAASGALTFTLSGGATLQFDLHGSGTSPGLGATPAALTFGQVPVGARVSLNVNITNTGTSAVKITGATAPAAPFGAGSLPAVGATLAPGAALSVPVTLAPTAAGPVSSTLTVASDAGSVSVPLTGTGVTGASHLTLSPTTVDLGSVPIGSRATGSFDIANTGNLLLTLNKAAPPAAPFGAADPVSEGQQLAPSEVIHQVVTFAPTTTGTFTGTYLITGSDGRGPQTVTVKGTGVAGVSVAVPGPSDPSWRLNGSATRTTGGVVLTTATANQAGDVVDSIPVRTEGLHASFTVRLGGGTGADGMTFALLDPARTSATSLGHTGGALGYGSLTGTAVTFDTFQNAGDPSGNFVGIASGATGAASDALTYLATAPAPTSLRAGTHRVDVDVAGGVVSVRMDGVGPLVAATKLPARALLAFTAGTGAVTDRHVVSDVSITQVPATGAVVGAAGRCLDVAGGATADGTAVQLWGCNGTDAQAWTATGASTLQALGSCLDVAGAGTTDGTTVQLWGCNGTPAQVWVPTGKGGLRNPNSGKCLDLVGGATAEGTKTVIATCTASATQSWRLPG